MKAPETPPALLPGRSAWHRMRIGVVGLLAGFPVLALIVLGAALAQPFKDLVMIGSLLVGFGLGAAAVWGGANALVTGLRERDAGYTTLHGTMTDFWQLDHRTGEVLRRPGERQVRRHPSAIK